MHSSQTFLPVQLNLKNRSIIIFGAGEVACRKATYLSTFSEVIIYSQEFSSKIDTNNKIQKIRQNLNHISDSELTRIIQSGYIIIPATNNSLINSRIENLANRSGVLVNKVDGIGDITFPATIQRGDIHISVSTSGKSPALAKFLKNRIINLLDKSYLKMLKLQNELRKTLKIQITEQQKRQTILKEVLDDDVVWEKLTFSYSGAMHFVRQRYALNKDTQSHLS